MSAATKSAPSRGGAKPSTGRAMDYIQFYRADPLDRIQIIKEGVSALKAKQIIHDLEISSSSAFKALRVPVATINRKAKNQELLSPYESERVLGVAKLIGQIEAMVEESGNPKGFNAPAWISRWLYEPLPAFGGTRPIELMDTMEGQALVSRTLGQIQSGAYA
jgi:putative toxin-antitoxin system antitoxin component (TIGR02293 family)